MKRWLLLLILLSAPLALAEQSGITSLRGMVPLDEVDAASAVLKFPRVSAPVRRYYLQQPPLIPHKVKGYKINRRSNKCMTCHGWRHYQHTGATKVSLTHFTDRDGVELADLAPRRYFCTQCHVTQVVAEPLVGNTYEPVPALKGK